MGQGFSVSPSKLQAGSQEVSRLQERSLIIAEDAIGALGGMTGSAGHAGLVSALGGAEGQGVRTFWALGVAYQHVSAGLAASAETYAGTERGIGAQFGTIFGKP